MEVTGVRMEEELLEIGRETSGCSSEADDAGRCRALEEFQKNLQYGSVNHGVYRKGAE